MEINSFTVYAPTYLSFVSRECTEEQGYGGKKRDRCGYRTYVLLIHLSLPLSLYFSLVERKSEKKANFRVQAKCLSSV